MKTLVILVSFSLTACAGKTVHEVCSNPDMLKRYQDYQQCYAEVSLERERTYKYKLSRPHLFNFQQTHEISTVCNTFGDQTRCQSK